MDAFFADAAASLHLTEQGLWLLVKAALILSAAWGLTAVVRHRSAAVRHVIWSAAMGLLILLPLLVSGLPQWRVDIPLLPASTQAGDAISAAVPDAVTGSKASGGTYLQAGSAVPGGASGFTRPEAIPAPTPEDGGFPLDGRSILLYLTVAWFGGALFLLGQLVWQLFRIRRLSGRAAPPVVSPPIRLTEELAGEMGIRRPVEVLCSDEIPVPITWGLKRPVIILPREASAWPDERLRVVLLHELAHIKRWDYLTHLISEVACAWYWPNPLVWFARGRVYAEQEQACDDRVLRSGTRSYEYAEHLLEIARAFQYRRRMIGGTIAMAREISLKDRIRAILDRGLDRHPLSPAATFAVTGLLVCLALPLAALHPGAAEPEASDTAEANLEGPLTGEEPGHVINVGAEVPAEHAYLWLEAEEGAMQEPMAAREDLGASSGYFVYVLDGDGNDAPQGGPGAVEFSLDIVREGEYFLWGRVIGDAGNDNSFFVSFDGGGEVRWDLQPPDGRGDLDEWTWLRLDAEEATAGFTLASGSHTVRIRNREDGSKLDRILLTSDPAFRPENRGPAATELEPMYLWMEAEEALRYEPMQVGKDKHASGHAYAHVPRNAGTDGAGGALRFVFEVSQRGHYVIWGRAIGADEEHNSFFASVDDGQPVIWDVVGGDPDRTARRWTWSPISSRDSRGQAGAPVIFDLQPGRHVLEVRNREDGTRFDGIFITNDLAYRPRGMRPTAPPARPVFVWIEAEDALVVGRMRAGEDGQASGSGYMQAEGSSHDKPPRDGSAIVQFHVPEPGIYTVWGRVGIPGDESNSFWVRMDDGAWVRWNDIRRGKTWHWDEVHDADYGGQLVQFDLAAGEHTLEIAYREAGTKLDKLLLTNDPAYWPRGTGDDAPAVAVRF